MNIQALFKKGINSLENNIFKNSMQVNEAQKEEVALEKSNFKSEKRAEVLSPTYKKQAINSNSQRQRGYRFSLPFLDVDDTKAGEYTSIHQIHVNRICPNPWQPRKTFNDDSIIELAESIRKHGLIQPITIRRLLEDNCSLGGLFCIVSGERRLRAMKYLEWEHIPCIILNTSAEGSASLALVENIVREDLNFFDEALAIAALSECHGLSREDISNRISLSLSAISNKLRLLRLSEAERNLIVENGLSERHARALLRIENDENRLSVLNYIIQNKLNVSSAEKYISELLGEVQECDTKQVSLQETVTSSLPVDDVCEETPKKKPIKSFDKKVDVKVYYKNILKTIGNMEQAGIGVTSLKNESDEVYELIIRIPKKTIDEREIGSISDELSMF